MKTLKTWEMIKELTENPDKKFKTEKGVEAYIKLGLLHIEDPVSGYVRASIISSETFPTDEWEEVKQPVPWLEAIEHHIKDKELGKWSFSIYMPDGEIWRQHSAHKLGYLSLEGESDTRHNSGFERKMFTEGKWYIEGR